MMYNMHNSSNDNNNNECQKFSEETFLSDFNKLFLKINLLLWKKAVMHTTTLMHCKARQVLRDLFGTNQGNGSKMTFVAGTNKVHMKNLNS